ncbi:MAG: AAA family ATPase [Candidatus Moraniibacteriota bacterium]
MSFFVWYYTRGFNGFMRVAHGYVRYALYRSNIFELLRTLVFPWRRDVAFRSWRGLHPLLALQAFFNNFLSRFLGMLVRLVVILAGLALSLGMVVSFTLLILLYLIVPLALLASFPLLFWSPWVLVLFAASLVMLLFAVLVWHQETEVDAMEHDLRRAPWLSRSLGRLGLQREDLAKEALVSRESLAQALGAFHIQGEEFDEAYERERLAFEKRIAKHQFFAWSNLKKKTPIGKYWAYGYTPHLDRSMTDLCLRDFSEYRLFELIGREKIFEMLTLTLTRPVQNSTLLIGEPGIGKKTIVHALARAIRENQFENPLLDKARIGLFDLGAVMAGARSDGLDPKSVVRSLLNEAVYAGNVVLVLENIDLYLSPESENHLGDVLSEYLGLPTCRIVGTLTQASYHRLTEHQLPVLKYFEPIPIDEPKNEETKRILLNYFEGLEKNRVVFTLTGLSAIIDAAERYNWETPFPERAIDLAQEAVLFWEKNPKGDFIDKQVIEEFLTLKSGVPLGEVSVEEKEKLLNLETLLHERIVGQHEAIRQLAEAFRKARAGLGNNKKPIGSFLFLGPTGVGKTETAKALAAVYFNNEENMVRLDMSEFQSPQSIADLIGSSDGAIPGRLTNLVKEHPFSILLLDELEKAHRQVLDLFLQVLDEGFVTDGFGHRVNFRNMIIIATSNAGADLIRSATEKGESMQDIKKTFIDAIIEKNTFRPEFLNRFDGVVLFNALTQEEIRSVTQKKLEVFSAKLARDKRVSLIFAPGVVERLVERGYEPEFGVRSINRYISDVVEDVLVKKLLSGEVAEGSKVVLTPDDL